MRIVEAKNSEPLTGPESPRPLTAHLALMNVKFNHYLEQYILYESNEYLTRFECVEIY